MHSGSAESASRCFGFVPEAVVPVDAAPEVELSALAPPRPKAPMMASVFKASEARVTSKDGVSGALVEALQQTPDAPLSRARVLLACCSTTVTPPLGRSATPENGSASLATRDQCAANCRSWEARCAHAWCV